MKIGILAYRQFPYISANTAIAYTLGRELSMLGHSIVNIGYFQSNEQLSVSKYENNKIVFLNKKLEKTSRIKNCIFKILGNKCRMWGKSKRLQQIITEEKIDVLISIIAPAENLLITYYSKLEIPVIVYQLDPFYNNMDLENLKSKKIFIKMISEMRYVFTTDLLYSEYKRDSSFSELINRISAIKFPKLVVKSYEKKKDIVNKVRLLYAGSFYHNIRNPIILIALKKALSENCEIVFCGGCDSEEDQELLRNAGITCKGYCSQQDVDDEIAASDILINIGNKVKNQLGSKIVDYIATGKPILNIFQIKECPTIPVLENYPYKINVDCNELENNNEIINVFLHNNIGKRAEWSQIQNVYQEYTPEYVAKKILKVIKES